MDLDRLPEERRARKAALFETRIGLVNALQDKIDSWSVSQETAAARLGVSRPMLNMVLNQSRYSTIDRLIALIEDAGMTVSITIVDPIGPSIINIGRQGGALPS